jgi:tetratricopeptide (TPR) repeat protein
MESIKLAKQCLNAALSRDQVDREEVFLNLGLAARCEGDYEAATQFANESLSISQDYAPAMELLSSLKGAKQAQEDANRH